jgi:cation diffusion facilitator CzcD-associated flavoprotein CzcO
MPQFPGMDQFKGEILHAKYYLGPEPYIGRSVMVVGNGPSGVDIATELADYAKPPVMLSQRTGVVLRPRYPYGLPKHLWMIIAEKLPDFIGKPLEEHIKNKQYKNLERYGIKTPHSEEETSAAGGTRGRELINAFKTGKVISVDGPQCFEPDAVVLTDGSRITPDVVIMATGYRPVLWRYLEVEADTDKDAWPLRIDEPYDEVWEGRREVIGCPGLYLVGVFYQGKGAMYNFNTEAQAAVEEIQQHLKNLRGQQVEPAESTEKHELKTG